MESAQHSQTVSLNNHAVSVLQTGDFENAGAFFSTAFKASNQALNQPSCDSSGPQPFPSLDGCISKGPLPHSPADLKGDTETEDFIFRKCIFIPQSLVPPTYRNKILVTTIVVFNLALCSHLRAMESKEQAFRSYHLRKAAQLYEQSFNLQGAHGASGPLATKNIFSMAALNNLGQVFRCLRENEKADKCFSNLLSTLMFMVDQNSDIIQGSYEYIRGFFKTTSHLMSQNKNMKVAAAA